MGCRELVEVVDVSKDTGKIFYFENRYILFLRNLEVGGMAAQSTDERKKAPKEFFRSAKVDLGNCRCCTPGVGLTAESTYLWVTRGPLR